MTDHYAVIGNPVAHSKSPFIHSEFARQTGQSLHYGTLLAPVDGFAETVKHFRSQGGKGLNITVPFKLQACEFASTLSASASQAQAVNLLHFKDNDVFGDNTDGIGLVRDIRDNLKCPLKGKKILLMGAGGAARGVMLPLLKEKPEQITIVNRTLDKAVSLKNIFSTYGKVDAAAYESLTGYQFDLIINATSSSLQNTLPPLSQGLFMKEALAYDMVYGKETPFLEFARKQGVKNRFDGIGMLVEQAAESFFIWRNVRPETAAVIKQLKQTL